MSLIRLIRISVNAIGRNKFRTFLTMLGIIIGVASVIAMLAIGQGSKKSIQEQISKMGSNMIYIRPDHHARGGVRSAAGSGVSLSMDDVEKIKKSARYVGAVSPLISGSGQVIHGALNWSTSLSGVDLDYFKIRQLTVKQGNLFTEKDIKSAAKVCLLGKTVVDNLFEEGEDPVGKMIRFKKIPFRVIGVIASKGETTFGHDQDDIIVAPYTTVQKRIASETYLQAIYTSAVSEDVSEKAGEEIEQILREAHRLGAYEESDFRVRSQQELLTTFESTSTQMSILLASIAAISLLVGGIGIMNIMYVSVTERTREIGLRMAVGARGVDIMYQFLIEAIIISVSGGIFGMGLGIGAIVVINQALKWPTEITPLSIILAVCVCAATGVFFGWYPAVKASRLDPIEALRYE